MFSLRVWLCFGIIIATTCVSALAAGISVGSSSLIETLDYSDTFTWTEYGGIPDRIGGFPMSTLDSPVNGVPGEGLAVENCYGNPARSWPDAKFSIDTDATALPSDTDPYPGGNGSGSDTGMTQTGGYENDWGFEYGLQDDFVIQFDGIQNQCRVNLTIGDVFGTVYDASCLSIFVRPADNPNANPQIGIYNDNVGEYDTGLASSIDTDGQWYNYGAHFDLTARTVEVFIDEQSLGTIDIDSVGDGAFSGMTLSAAAVSVGYWGGDRFWTDNFQIGSARAGLVNKIPGDANYDGTVDDEDAAALAANWQTTGGATWGMGDFNGDGNVDDIDATLLATNWQGSTTATASVPEPSVLLLLLGGAFWSLIRRQRG